MNTSPKDENKLGVPAVSAPLERREFIKLIGEGIVVSFAVENPLDIFAWQQGARRSPPEDFNAYVRIGADGRVECFSGKVELGQGVSTSLAQICAEELEVPFSSVDMVMSDTDRCPWDGGTNGSRTIKYFGPLLRAAAAEAREILIQLAAEQLKVPAENLAAKDGAVVDRSNPGRRISYGTLAQGKKIEKHLGAKPPLKPYAAYAVSGKSVPRTDALQKTTGKAVFAGDIRLPGMLYARILRPPAHGAKLKKIDVSGAKDVPDARVIQDGDFVAVLHPHPDEAEKALSRIEAEFETPEVAADSETIWKHLEDSHPQGNVVQQKGDLETGRKLSALTFDETYYTPYVAHAATETHTAVAQIEGQKVTVWASTQSPFGVQEQVAKALGASLEQVRVVAPFVGGGFGGKTQGPQAVEAARLARLAGCPVQVAWSRAEEFFHDTFMPAAVVKIKSGLNESNQIVYWDYQVLFAGERSSEPIYDIPHQKTMGLSMTGVHPFGTGAWRGPGSNTNVFAKESHIDIMAARVGIDPLEFRLKNLTDERMIRVVRAAAEKFGWKPAKSPSGRGYGISCQNYLNTYVVAMGEIKVDRNTGQIRVVRVVMAQDTGQVINPDGARMQMESGITMGLGYTTTEEIKFKGGAISHSNFDSYEIPRFSWVPAIEPVLVDNPELAPQGCGEPAVTCMGGMMANALFDAVGVRLRRLPLTAERVKAAMAKPAPAG